MSTAQAPISAVVEDFSDAFTELVRETARTSTSVYREGLEVIVEQQRLAGEASRQWLAEMVSLQADFGRQVTRGYASAANESAAAVIESTEQVQDTATDTARRTATRRPTNRRRTAARRQTSQGAASPPAAKAAAVAVEALAPGWNSEATTR